MSIHCGDGLLICAHMHTRTVTTILRYGKRYGPISGYNNDCNNNDGNNNIIMIIRTIAQNMDTDNNIDNHSVLTDRLFSNYSLFQAF